MKRNGLFKGLSVLLALLLLVGLFPQMKLTASAVELNKAITADPAAWGTQGNNGWYYLYKLTDGTYHEMNFYDGSDEIGWRQNAFASDLSTTVEMFFINQGAVFYGENNTRPVFAYEAPESGDVTLRMQTHSTEQMHMQVYVNNTLQQIGGEDSLTLTTTGTLPGGMTLTELMLNVTKGQRIYVEFYSTDMGAQRQAWVNEYSVTYTRIDETPEDITGKTFAPDPAAWGAQGNNGWYYLYKLTDGTYHEMNFYDGSDEIGWRQNAFASDLSTTVEMFFINQGAVFYGENNTRPVYAFEAPETGEVTLRMQTHSTEQMHMQVYVKNTLQQIGGEDSLTLTTTGELPGAMTLTELALSVKKGQRIYVEFYSTDMSAQRQAWVNEYSVTYNSVQPGDEPDLTGHTFAPDLAAWGIQGNNGWYYMYQSGSTGQYGLLNYYDATAEIPWQQNNYAFDPYTMGEMLFVDQIHFFTGELGSKPVYAFRAPASGKIKVYFEIHGQSAMSVSAFVENESVQIEEKDSFPFTTEGTLPGAFTPVTFETQIEKGQMLYLVCGSSDGAIRDGWFRNQSVTYLEMSVACAHGETEIRDAADATCTEDGYTGDTYCLICGEKIAEGEIIPAPGHTPGEPVTENEVAATCTAAGGYDTVVYCTVCTAELSRDHTDIPALGHDWNEPTYVWAEDNGSVTATRTCKRDESHVETEQVNTTSEVTREATYEEEGEITYTATFTNPAFAAQVKKVATPKLVKPVLNNPFTDVKDSDYFYDAVLWAVNAEPQITNGTGATTFSPNDTCTRAQVVTFLWRAKGCPEPTKSENPFKDVKETDYFYKAVLWAVENEITNGTSADTFSPNAGCTRGQVVTFLWRAEGKPAPEKTENPFGDVKDSDFYYSAVLWAVEKEITKGTSDTTFSPSATCTRGQIATFLYRNAQ